MKLRDTLIVSGAIVIADCIIAFAVLASRSPQGGTSVPAQSSDAEAKRVIDGLQGDWVVERSESDGRPDAGTPGDNLVFTLKGNELIPSRDSNDISRIELFPEKNPAWINMTIPGDKIDPKESPTPGIYRINGDRWEICMRTDNSKVRPTEFKSSPGSHIVLMILRRRSRWRSVR